MDATQAKNMIEAVYSDGSAEIGKHSYKFEKCTHKKRLKVFAFFTKYQKQLSNGDFSFLDTPEWDSVELVINNMVTIDGHLLSKLCPDHWEEHPSEFLKFISIALPVVCYPFMSADPTS